MEQHYMRNMSIFLFIYLVFLVANTTTFASDKKHDIYSERDINLKLNNDPFIQQIVNQVSADSILSYLQKLESFGMKSPDSTALNAARDWLYTKYLNYGYTDIAYHDFTYSSYTLQNIIVTKEGISSPDVTLIIDGHYDTIGGPGVNDNGSGVAVILETARLLANIECDYTIKFINFSAEEQGLIGSNAYVNQIVVPQNMNILLVFNIDEVGGVAGMVNNTITCERDEGSPSSNNAASAAYTDTLAALTETYSNLSTVIAHAYGSDYMPFEDAGYVITGYYETNESPYPHGPNDILANMDPVYVTEITKGAIANALYFARSEKYYLKIFHNPITAVQDTINPYYLEVASVSSSPLTTKNCLYQVNNGGYNTVVMNLSGVNGDTSIYTAYIPAQGYNSVIDYYFLFENQDSISTRLPDSAGIYYQFKVNPDTVPPQISHTAKTDQSYLINPIDFEVQATDDNGISQVFLYLKQNDNPEIEIVMNWAGDNRYHASYANVFVPGDSIYYRFKAIDNSANFNVQWFPASTYFAFELLNSEVFDFEQNENLFSGSGDWQWGIFNDVALPSPAGNKVWATVLAGNYSGNQVSQLRSPQIDMTNKSDIKLILNHFYQIEPVNDGGNIKIAVDSTYFQLIEPITGYPYTNLYLFNEPGYSGNSYYWTVDEFDLSAYSGHKVQLLFDFRSDLFTNKKGWYIDYIRIDFRGDISNHAPQIMYFWPVTLDTLNIGSQQTFIIRAEDIDGDSLSYSFIHKNEIINDTTATFTFNTTGIDTVIARVEDGKGKVATHEWIFFVKDPTLIIKNGDLTVRDYYLYPPHPNPFNLITNIVYEINKPGYIEISVYNITGQKISTLFEDFRSKGKYNLQFDGSPYSSGVYLVRFAAQNFEDNYRIILIK